MGAIADAILACAGACGSTAAVHDEPARAAESAFGAVNCLRRI